MLLLIYVRVKGASKRRVGKTLVIFTMFISSSILLMVIGHIGFGPFSVEDYVMLRIIEVFC